MKRAIRADTRTRCLRTALALLIAGLALCFAPPAQPRPAGTLNPSFVAEQLMTTVTATRRWAEFIYRIRRPEPRQCEPFVGELVRNSDGSVSRLHIDEQCTRTYVTVFPSLSYRRQITYRDGLRETIEAVAGDYLHPPGGNPQTFRITHRFSNGNRAQYVEKLELFDFGEGAPAEILAEHYQGAFVSRSARVPFSLDRHLDVLAPPEMDTFRSTLPGGAKIALEILIAPVERQPLFEKPAVGTLTLRGRKMPFRLTARDADEQRWDELAIGPADPEDRRGRVPNGFFLLGDDFSGRGQMYRGRKLDFVARWDARQTAQVVFASGQVTSAGPSAGLQDFLTLRWSGIASGVAPGL